MKIFDNITDIVRDDLKWKPDYFQAKQRGKAFDEFCKTKRKIACEQKDGGLK